MEPYDIRDVVFRFRYPKIGLELGHDTLKRESHEHIYVVRLDATNNGPAVLRDYLMQVTAPVDCLTHIPTENWTVDSYSDMGAVRLVTLSQFTGIASPEVWQVYPQQTRNLRGSTRRWRVEYKMDTQLDRELHRLYKSTFRCTVYGVDMPPVTVEKPFREMHEF